MWARGRSRSNVWIATVRDVGGALALHDLRRVQQLPGPGEPFDRLAALLGAGAYSAAGIDAPFSVPESRCPARSHPVLLARAAGWEREGRPFAPARALVRDLLPEAGPRGTKEYRATERGWGVSVRSTTWAGPRGGAAMTVACLTLLARVRRPVWPFVDAPSSAGVVVEAFPAAQLRTWRLPFYGYNGTERPARERRREIVRHLRQRLELGGREALLFDGADALDAVLCAFAGIAVRRRALARGRSGPGSCEGWIAVHG
jgi:hypothetical protein